MITAILFAALMMQESMQKIEEAMEAMNEPRYSIPKPIEQPANISKSPVEKPKR